MKCDEGGTLAHKQTDTTELLRALRGELGGRLPAHFDRERFRAEADQWAACGLSVPMIARLLAAQYRAEPRRNAPRMFTWAVYWGTALVGEGEAPTWAAVTRPAIEAAYADAARRFPSSLVTSQDLSGYRISVWGPRGGSREHQAPLMGKIKKSSSRKR